MTQRTPHRGGRTPLDPTGQAPVHVSIRIPELERTLWQLEADKRAMTLSALVRQAMRLVIGTGRFMQQEDRP